MDADRRPDSEAESVTAHANAVAPAMQTRTWLLLLALFLLLLVVRLLGSTANGFVEEDETGIALGVAAILVDSPGGLYRYTVQLGYYRLVEALVWLSGGGVAAVPPVMKGLSVLAGALIPITGFFAFRQDLPARERWLVLLVLALNPVLWKSSQYGNTATPALALTVAALVILSNRPGRWGKTLALVLLGMGVLVRADSVLVLPLVPFLLRRSEGSRGRALAWSGAFGAGMLLVYTALFAVDPRIDSAAIAVMNHMTGTQSPTMFWEYLLWAVSPLPFIFAIWGVRDLARTNPRLLGWLLLWGVPTLLFYFRATTTPRYFLNAVVPLSVAAAIGMRSLADRLRAWMPATLASALVVAAAGLHLFVALGHFRPDVPGQMFRGAEITGTADGVMPTGALLYSTFTAPNSLLRSLPDLRFEAAGSPAAGDPVMSQVVQRLADPAAPPRTIVMLLSDDWPSLFHFHALAAGGRYLARPETDVWCRAPIRMELGNVRVITVGLAGPFLDTIEHFDVMPGDEFWVFRDPSFPDPTALARLPAGLTLEPATGSVPAFRTFRVVPSPSPSPSTSPSPSPSLPPFSSASSPCPPPPDGSS